MPTVRDGPRLALILKPNLRVLALVARMDAFDYHYYCTMLFQLEQLPLGLCIEHGAHYCIARYIPVI
jgi:hypothetical protein